MDSYDYGEAGSVEVSFNGSTERALKAVLCRCKVSRPCVSFNGSTERALKVQLEPGTTILTFVSFNGSTERALKEQPGNSSRSRVACFIQRLNRESTESDIHADSRLERSEFHSTAQQREH